MRTLEHSISSAATISLASSLEEAATIFARMDLPYACVTSDGTIVGLVSSRSIRAALEWADGGTNIACVMAKNPPSLSVFDSVIDAALRLLEERLPALPVLRDGELLGVFTAQDCARAARAA